MSRVIGPQGSKIRVARERSGARIDIENECEPGTDSQPITIKGSDEQVATAVALINESLSVPPAPLAPTGGGYAIGGGAPPGDGSPRSAASARSRAAVSRWATVATQPS